MGTQNVRLTTDNRQPSTRLPIIDRLSVVGCPFAIGCPYSGRTSTEVGPFVFAMKPTAYGQTSGTRTTA